MEPLHCDGCGNQMGWVEEMDLNGSSFACSTQCATLVAVQNVKQREALAKWEAEESKQRLSGGVTR